jgi:hypothetical protein
MSDPHDPAGGKPPPRPALPRPGPPHAPPRAAPGAQKTRLGAAVDTSVRAPIPNVETTPRRQTDRTLAFEALPDDRERDEEAVPTQRTVAFEARPDPALKRQTTAFEALPADTAEARSPARQRKKGLSSTLAFGDDEIAAAQREVERLRQEEARAEAQATAGRGDRRTPTQFAAAPTAVPTTPAAARKTPVHNLDRTVAFEAPGSPEPSPEPAPRKKRTFGATIAFGAMADAQAEKPRSQTIAFDAMPERPASQPPKGGMAATMAFEAPSYRPELAPAPAHEAAASTNTDSSARPRSARRGELGSTVAFDPNEGRHAGEPGLGSTMAFESPLAGKGAMEIVDESSQISVPEAQRATKRTMIGGTGFQPPLESGPVSPTNVGLGPGGYPAQPNPPQGSAAVPPAPPEAPLAAEPFRPQAGSTPPEVGAHGPRTEEFGAAAGVMGGPGIGAPGAGVPGMDAPGAPAMGAAPQGGYGAPVGYGLPAAGGPTPYAVPPGQSSLLTPFPAGPSEAMTATPAPSSKKTVLVIVAVVLLLVVATAVALWLTGVV